MSYKKICYVNTIYPLLIFLLLHADENEDELFFFLGKSIPEGVAKNLKNSKHLNNNFKIKNKFLRYKEIYKVYKDLEDFLIKENLKNREIYLQDHIQHAQFFLNHIDNCFSLEDGVVNYITKNYSQNKISLKKKIKIFRNKILKRCKNYYPELGRSEKIKKIYLTGLMEIPEIIKDKVEIINLKSKWDSLSLSQKNKILNIFNLNHNELEEIKGAGKRKILLITQSFSEDKFISEEEKIELYKNLIKNYNSEEILLKPHPRERTDYSKIFPNIKTIRGSFPLEILMVLGIKFEEVVTVSSTAALNFKGISNINFQGTEVYPEIKENLGEIKGFYSKIK